MIFLFERASIVKTKKVFFTLILFLAPAALARSIIDSGKVTNLTVIHINDIHAHFEETNIHTGRCRQQDADSGDCYGGMARIQAKAKVSEVQRGLIPRTKNEIQLVLVKFRNNIWTV